jgi:hypothetical protein
LAPEQNKIKCLFKVKEKQAAKRVYFDLCKNPYIFESNTKALIYLQMPEEVFVKHGDIQAKKYYEEEE